MYESYNEVFHQGEILTKTYEYILSKQEAITDFIRENSFDEVVFVACGSSYWLSTSACMTLQEKLGKRCSAVSSGDVVMNPEYYKKAYRNPMIIAPSRSGSTSETLIALELFRKTYGSKVISIVEYTDAPIGAFTDLLLEIPWANEISVCQTRSFSSLYLACIIIAAIVACDTVLLQDLQKYLTASKQHSEQAESLIRTIIAEFPGWKSLVTIGSGKQFGVSCEGAYICIEMAQFPSNYYATLELRHGPIVMLDESYLVCVFSNEAARSYEENMAEDSQKKKARVAAITAEDNFSHADYCFNLGHKACPEVVALYGIMVMQGFAHLKAVDMGIDPDNPRELVPWIRI